MANGLLFQQVTIFNCMDMNLDLLLVFLCQVNEQYLCTGALFNRLFTLQMDFRPQTELNGPLVFIHLKKNL